MTDDMINSLTNTLSILSSPTAAKYQIDNTLYLYKVLKINNFLFRGY